MRRVAGGDLLIGSVSVYVDDLASSLALVEE